MILKELLSLLAIALTFVAFVPYIRSILNRKTRPHVFSWCIWSTTTLIIFFLNWMMERVLAPGQPLYLPALLALWLTWPIKIRPTPV